MGQVTPEEVELRSDGPDATFAYGKALGEALLDGDFVGLSGQLGAGKTLFCRGVAQGAGVPLDDVSSPTYAIIQSYRGHLLVHHADFYRLKNEADLISTGFEDLLEANEGAFLVEWIDQVPTAAPDDALRLTLRETSPSSRSIFVKANGPRSQALLARWVASV